MRRANCCPRSVRAVCLCPCGLSDADLELALKALGFEIAPESRAALFAQAGGSVSEALKLVNYGGLEILNAFENVLSQPPGGQQRQDLIKLAEALSAKGARYDLRVFHRQSDPSHRTRRQACRPEW